MTHNHGKPIVSVGIPTYNNAEGLKDALKCITNQTYTNLEILIADNASTDIETQELINNYQMHDKRIISYKHEQNMGALYNYNFVLEKATGEYFMWAADDDTWDASFIEKLISKLELRTECDIAFCSVRRIREDGTVFDVIDFSDKDRPDTKSYLELALAITTPLKYNVFIYGLFRSTFLKKLLFQGIPELYVFDRLFILHVSLATKFVYVDEVLFTKKLRDVPENIRRPEEKRNQKSYFPTLLYMWPFILKSRVVPFRRKIFTPLLFAVLLVKYAARDTATKLLRATLFKNPKLKKYIKELYLSHKKTH